jgi:NADH-quinone oxidoreductase subunit A
MQHGEWFFIAIFLVVSMILPAVPIILAQFLRPRKPNKVKLETYECGVETVGDAWVQFKVQYYLYALVFLVFDIEMLFLFPWAVAMNQLPIFGIVVMITFIAILGVGLAYAWRKGALEWN